MPENPGSLQASIDVEHCRHRRWVECHANGDRGSERSLADALDISHREDVTDITLQERGSIWTLKLSRKKDQILVKWALGKRKSSFREVFGVDLELD